MKKESIRFLKLFVGLFICSLGCVTILKSNLGLAPWDVLHQGVSKVTGITIGQASISLGVIIVLMDIFLGQPIGVGTVLNFIFIGLFMDLIIFLDFIPIFQNLFARIIELLVGIFFYSYGTYLYMTQGMGCGPSNSRDLRKPGPCMPHGPLPPLLAQRSDRGMERRILEIHQKTSG